MNEQHSQKEIEVYQLRIRLKSISPMIWRRILVRSDSSIAQLHKTIQYLMGWSNEHLHRFVIHGVEYGENYLFGLNFIDDGREVLLSDFQFRDGQRFLYEYDMFDQWQHEIRMEKRLPLVAEQSYPICVGGGATIPPEDCGGPNGFMALRSHNNKARMLIRMAEIVSKVIEGAEDDPINIDRSELRKVMFWYEIDKFNLKEATQRLADYRAGKPMPDIILGE